MNEMFTNYKCIELHEFGKTPNVPEHIEEIIKSDYTIYMNCGGSSFIKYEIGTSKINTEYTIEYHPGLFATHWRGNEEKSNILDNWLIENGANNGETILFIID